MRNFNTVLVSAIAFTSSVSAQNREGTSRDARCGPFGEGTTCLNSQWGNCCSQYGWCGSTIAYCGEGCIHGFGKCNGAASSSIRARSSTSTRTTAASASATTASARSPSASPIQAISHNARCGADFGSQTCQGSEWGNCCSKYFYCGSTEAYCGPDSCQKGYGQCNTISSLSRATSMSTSISKSSSSSKISSSLSSTKTSSPTKASSSSIKASSSSTKSSSSSTKSSSSSTKSSSSSTKTALTNPVITSSSSTVTSLSSTISSAQSTTPSSSPSATWLSSTTMSSIQSSTLTPSPSPSVSACVPPPPFVPSSTRPVANPDFENESLMPWTVTGSGYDFLQTGARSDQVWAGCKSFQAQGVAEDWTFTLEQTFTISASSFEYGLVAKQESAENCMVTLSYNGREQSTFTPSTDWVTRNGQLPRSETGSSLISISARCSRGGGDARLWFDRVQLTPSR